MVLLATSSRPNSIEKALRRPGRLDKETELGVPSSAQREAILRQLCQEMHITVIEDEDSSERSTTSSEAVLRRVAATAHGMVASDLTELIKEALSSSVSREMSRSADAVGDLASSLSGLHIDEITAPASQRASHLVTERALLSAAKAISPSALREIVVEVPEVRWTDIGGMDVVKRSLQEVGHSTIPVLFVLLSPRLDINIVVFIAVDDETGC